MKAGAGATKARCSFLEHALAVGNRKEGNPDNEGGAQWLCAAVVLQPLVVINNCF
jgi:hypothetical protein